MTAHKPMQAARIAAFLSAVAIANLVSGPAFAGDCNEDIGNLTKKRQAIMDQLNHMAKGGKSQLDPIAACPKLRALVAAEHELVAYLTKNKEWCAIPDQALENITTNTAKSGGVANQACAAAAQMKKAQEQQATGELNAPPGQKLPTGPL